MDDSVSDQTLIEQVRQGDRAAFEQIVRRHQGAVYGYLRARLIHVADAEDLTQEAFLRCYVARARFDSTCLVRPWLLGIARNLLREHVRKIKKRKETAWTELCLELEELVPGHDDQYDCLLQGLPTCLGGLGQSARRALDMYYASKLRLAEIGEQLHRSEGAVKLLLYRARQAVKRCLDGQGGAVADDRS